MRISDGSLERVEVCRLAGAGDDYVDVALGRDRQTFRETRGRYDVILGQDYDERCARRPSRTS